MVGGVIRKVELLREMASNKVVEGGCDVNLRGKDFDRKQ
jgi:hypothetical protein